MSSSKQSFPFLVPSLPFPSLTPPYITPSLPHSSLPTYLTPSSLTPSLPTELLVTYFKDSTCVKFDSVDKYWASSLTYDACISPCSIVFSMLYIDRLRVSNPEYLKTTASQELFIVSMVGMVTGGN